MRYERDGCKPIEDPSEKQVTRDLSRLKGCRRSFALLTEDDFHWVQMAGGGMCCCIEWRDGDKQYRAFQDKPVVPWKGITKLTGTGLGMIDVEQHEFFRIEQVTAAFLAFLDGTGFPAEIRWRDITKELSEYGVGPESEQGRCT